MHSELRLLRHFVEVLKKNNKNTFFAASSELKKQTSVALIFRFNPLIFTLPKNEIEIDMTKTSNFYESNSLIIEHLQNIEKKLPKEGENLHLLELLLIKRGNHVKDRHQGQIAFPGGKCEPGENDFMAVKREALEEVGFDLGDTNSFLGLGKIPLNTWAYYHEPGKSTYISTYVFFQIPPSLPLKHHSEEVQKAFWQPFNRFLQRRFLKREIDFQEGQNYFFSSQFLLSLFQKIFFKNFESRIYLVLPLENGEKIYGITYNIMMYIIGTIKKEAAGDPELNDELKEIGRLLNKCFEISFFVKRKWFGGYSKIKGKGIWWVFYWNRIRQFKVK